jgi:alpha-beta hydrolase superfamily lysophospholipase
VEITGVWAVDKRIFIAVPNLTPPVPGSIFRERFIASGAESLWYGVAEVAGPVRAEVVVTHGLGEHARRYEHVAERLAQAGLRVHAYDLRGHGRSTGRRGDAAEYGALLDDLERVCELAGAAAAGPLFLLGHSLGGQITLNFLLERKGACRGAVIASPWLRLAFYPNPWRLAVARAALRVWPTWPQRTPGGLEVLSRDAAHLASLAQPELRHNLISSRLFFAVDAAGREALARAGELRAPVLLLHGGADAVTSAEATREFFAAAGSVDKTLKVYPESLHETLNDLEREQVLGDVVAWLGERAGEAG